MVQLRTMMRLRPEHVLRFRFLESYSSQSCKITPFLYYFQVFCCCSIFDHLISSKNSSSSNSERHEATAVAHRRSPSAGNGVELMTVEIHDNACMIQGNSKQPKIKARLQTSAVWKQRQLLIGQLLIASSAVCWSAVCWLAVAKSDYANQLLVKVKKWKKAEYSRNLW